MNEPTVCEQKSKRGRPKLNISDEERKERIRESKRKYREKNREKLREYSRAYNAKRTRIINTIRSLELGT